MYGYGGRILALDLTSGQSRVEELSESFARAFLGGNGFAIRLLHDRVGPGVDPLSPDNAIVFAVGPITDTTVVGNSRCCVGTKSPLNGLFFDSTFGGQFPCTFKRTGFDALLITGRAARPVYLLVEEGGVRLKPADGLWGKTTGETIQAVLEREGADADVLAPGEDDDVGPGLVAQKAVVYAVAGARLPGEVVQKGDAQARAARVEGHHDDRQVSRVALAEEGDGHRRKFGRRRRVVVHRD